MGDQHTVEGIAMRTRQPPDAFAITNGDGQFFEALVRDAAGDIVCHGFGLWKLTETMFGGNFPSGRRADEYDVLVIGNHSAGRFG